MAAVNSILQVENLTKLFGDLVLFENISFGLSEGQRVGLIAKNGSGKSTLLNILSGKEGYDGGTISFRRDIRVGYLEQDPQYPEELTVLEACFHHGNSTVELIKEYERCMETEGHPGLDEILVRMDHEKAWEYEQKAKQILSQLKIRDFNQQVKSLSGGQLKRVALANTLITEPDLLILDEPTNHLDLDMTEWLEDYLRRTNLTLLMVTHDRYFLDRVCSEIIEIDNRRIYQYKGNYSYYLEKRFDVLLTDIQMPAMNGFDLLKAIRTLDTSWVQTLPVIALTARSDMDENYFCSHGFAGCLHKPFTINELFTAIFQVTGKDVPATGNPTPHIAPAKENHPQQETLDFSALTAFSEDDPEAASEILRTFISETKKNRECMEEALAKKNMEDITAIAHKLLPLFTMLGATRCIPALTWMEQRRGTTEIGEEAIEKTNFIIEEIEKVIDEAKKQIEIPNEA